MLTSPAVCTGRGLVHVPSRPVAAIITTPDMQRRKIYSKATEANCKEKLAQDAGTSSREKDTPLGVTGGVRERPLYLKQDLPVAQDRL